MAYANGRLPSSALAPITRAANGQQAYLRKDAAAAFNAMNAESERRYGVTLRVSSARVAYRTIAEQNYFWGLYTSGRGALAARPGTSNHGWGLAVDLATPQMRSIVNAIGAKYGWAKQWSDAPSEWWHLKWREGNYAAVKKNAAPRVLRRGMRGEDVQRLAVMLRKTGDYRPKKAGKLFGPEVLRAVKRFQRRHKLAADGVVGPKTLATIKRAYKRRTK